MKSRYQLMGLATIAILMASAALPVQGQSAGDIVVIGNSPGDWSRNQAYWNQILGLTRPKTAAPRPGTETAKGQSTEAIQQELLRNISISEVKLEPIIKLNGSSLVSGRVTNNNRQPVTVTSVNFQILDAQGKLIQTGSATPEPATIPPGQTVTFQRPLDTVPADSGAKIQLSNPPIGIQGGV